VFPLLRRQRPMAGRLSLVAQKKKIPTRGLTSHAWFLFNTEELY